MIFLQRKIFGTKFGSFCTIQKRFDQNWITNSIAVRVYFWALFANLDFPNSLLAPLCSGAAYLRNRRFIKAAVARVTEVALRVETNKKRVSTDTKKKVSFQLGVRFQ